MWVQFDLPLIEATTGLSGQYAQDSYCVASREYARRRRDPILRDAWLTAKREKRLQAESRITARRVARLSQPKKKTRAEIKLEGGAAYAALLLKERESRALFRRRHPDKVRALRRKHKKRKSFKFYLCHRARMRAAKKGIEGTITPADLIWPTHCPALGLELHYPKYAGQCGSFKVPANWPSLDRLDPTKGYVPGNVRVISFRANTLKNNMRRDEALKIARYVLTSLPAPCPI